MLAVVDSLHYITLLSQERCFNLVTFIDTPGLVDGSFHYPFPVEDIIVSMARHTDLIYIFFDPIGQVWPDSVQTVEQLTHACARARARVHECEFPSTRSPLFTMPRHTDLLYIFDPIGQVPRSRVHQVWFPKILAH